ncbi:MAG TPA: circadian clock KaiB family protein [Gemmatimonadaceae bacterium]|jgi:circadian clock protein KaiB
MPDHQRSDEQPQYLLTLFITGSSPRADLAIANLRHVCEGELCGEYDLEIVDVLEHPERAEEAKILATPTLIKRLPPPLRRVVGDLSDKDKLLVGLELHAARKAANKPTEK